MAPRAIFAALALAALAAGSCNNPSGTVTPTNQLAACVTASACGVISGGVTGCAGVVAQINNPFVAGLAKIGPSTVNCLAVAGKDCAAARRCLNGGAEPQPCTGGSSCNGTVLVGCSAQASTGGAKGTTQFDCQEGGAMCVGSGGAVGCGVATCAPGPAEKLSCLGNVLQTCSKEGIVTQLDCASFGATCVTGALGISYCRGGGASCTGSLSDLIKPKGVRCDGNRVVYCFDGQEATFDCGRLQLGCVPNARAEGTADCALGSECDPTKYAPTCAGTKLTICQNGKVVAFDCASSGFTACDPAGGGSCR